MEELIEYILQFGSLNKQQIDLIAGKAEEMELRKDQYFSEAGKRIVKYAMLDKNGVTGKFISEETNPLTGEIPW